MRYITWKLKWTDEYGHGPESVVHSKGSSLKASMFFDSSTKNGQILGYLEGDLDVTFLADFECEEITDAEALEFAKNLDSTSFFLEDGTIATAQRAEI